MDEKKTFNLKPLKVFACIIFAILLVSLVVVGIFSSLERRELLRVIDIMDDFENVDRIVIIADAAILEFSIEDQNFEDTKTLLYPFHDGRGGISASIKRELLRFSDSEPMEITYFVDGDVLLVLNVHLFASYPHMVYERGFGNNLFVMNCYYHIAFVNNGNFMASMGFSELDLDSLMEIAS